jgi:hypothetical protein|uniref:Uncharacterized protein n=1 Tax=Fagus sylvatica TaxID=28930 RepID=A0A2N9GTR0_FAGSY
MKATKDGVRYLGRSPPSLSQEVEPGVGSMCRVHRARTQPGGPKQFSSHEQVRFRLDRGLGDKLSISDSDRASLRNWPGRVGHTGENKPAKSFTPKFTAATAWPHSKN